MALNNDQLLFFTVRDITEKKKVREELNTEREKYRALVESSTDAIYMVNLDGLVTFVNSFGAKMLGREVESVIGKRINTLFPKKIAETQKDFIKKVFAHNYLPDKQNNFDRFIANSDILSLLSRTDKKREASLEIFP